MMAEIGPPKRTTGDLAVLGGDAAFREPLHVGRPNIGDRAALFERIEGALDRRILSNRGPLVEEFERRIASIASVRHAVAVVNATTGLEIAARALGLAGEVVVPSFTFVGTVHALDWMGLTPVFGDISPGSPTLDPDGVERLIGPRTSAILGVHLWGHACDVDRLGAIAAAHGIPIIYDAAHGLMNTHAGRPVGSFGVAEVFSFHATKFVNAFEGGAITTDDDGLAERMREMRNFGFLDFDVTISGGSNAKMHEASAAMGLTSLDSADDFIQANRRNARAYGERLANIDGLEIVSGDIEDSNAQYVVIRIDAAAAGLERDALQQVLLAENVLARRYFYPGCHRLEPYRSRPELVREPLPHTERLAAEVLVLPTGTAISVGHVDAISDLIRFALRAGPDIGPRLLGPAP